MVTMPCTAYFLQSWLNAAEIRAVRVPEHEWIRAALLSAFYTFSGGGNFGLPTSLTNGGDRGTRGTRGTGVQGVQLVVN